jgi:hypothetical protein
MNALQILMRIGYYPMHELYVFLESKDRVLRMQAQSKVAKKCHCQEARPSGPNP